MSDLILVWIVTNVVVDRIFWVNLWNLSECLVGLHSHCHKTRVTSNWWLMVGILCLNGYVNCCDFGSHSGLSVFLWWMWVIMWMISKYELYGARITAVPWKVTASCVRGERERVLLVVTVGIHSLVRSFWPDSPQMPRTIWLLTCNQISIKWSSLAFHVEV